MLHTRAMTFILFVVQLVVALGFMAWSCFHFMDGSTNAAICFGGAFLCFLAASLISLYRAVTWR